MGSVATFIGDPIAIALQQFSPIALSCQYIEQVMYGNARICIDLRCAVFERYASRNTGQLILRILRRYFTMVTGHAGNTQPKSCHVVNRSVQVMQMDGLGKAKAS